MKLPLIAPVLVPQREADPPPIHFDADGTITAISTADGAYHVTTIKP
ncbi:MAG TPA: hypothetical protein VHM90_05025 [Phycisphaerae bacterium]|nr:hypothetical protein [Phycisphaerae bacterium]